MAPSTTQELGRDLVRFGVDLLTVGTILGLMYHLITLIWSPATQPVIPSFQWEPFWFWLQGRSLEDRLLMGGLFLTWSMLMFLLFRDTPPLDDDSDDDSGGTGEDPEEDISLEEVSPLRFNLPKGRWLAPSREAPLWNVGSAEMEPTQGDVSSESEDELNESEGETRDRYSRRVWVYEPPVTRSQTRRRRRRLDC